MPKILFCPNCNSQIEFDYTDECGGGWRCALCKSVFQEDDFDIFIPPKKRTSDLDNDAEEYPLDLDDAPDQTLDEILDKIDK